MKTVVTLLFITLLFTSCNSHLNPPNKPLLQSVDMYKLTNGLTVYLDSSMSSSSKMVVSFAVKTGFGYEQPFEAEYSHLIEHMAFNGTTHFPGLSIQSIMEKKGYPLGEDFNAFTENDITFYKMRIASPTESFTDTLFLFLSDVLSHIHFDKTSVENEKKVITEELFFRNRLKTGIERTIDSLIHRTANPDMINRIPIHALKQFYTRWYQPENCAILITGSFNKTFVKQAINKHLSQPLSVNSTYNTPHVSFWEQTSSGTHLYPAIQSGAVAAFQLPLISRNHPGKHIAKCLMLKDLLFESFISFQSIAPRTTSASFNTLRQIIEVHVISDQMKADSLAALSLSCIQYLLKHGWSDYQFQKVRDAHIFNAEQSLRHYTHSVDQRMQDLLGHFCIGYAPNSYESKKQMKKWLQDFTAAEMHDFLKECAASSSYIALLGDTTLLSQFSDPQTKTNLCGNPQYLLEGNGFVPDLIEKWCSNLFSPFRLRHYLGNHSSPVKSTPITDQLQCIELSNGIKAYLIHDKSQVGLTSMSLFNPTDSFNPVFTGTYALNSLNICEMINKNPSDNIRKTSGFRNWMKGFDIQATVTQLDHGYLFSTSAPTSETEKLFMMLNTFFNDKPEFPGIDKSIKSLRQSYTIDQVMNYGALATDSISPELYYFSPTDTIPKTHYPYNTFQSHTHLRTINPNSVIMIKSPLDQHKITYFCNRYFSAFICHPGNSKKHIKPYHPKRLRDVHYKNHSLNNRIIVSITLPQAKNSLKTYLLGRLFANELRHQVHHQLREQQGLIYTPVYRVLTGGHQTPYNKIVFELSSTSDATFLKDQFISIFRSVTESKSQSIYNQGIEYLSTFYFGINQNGPLTYQTLCELALASPESMKEISNLSELKKCVSFSEYLTYKNNLISHSNLECILFPK